MATLEQRIEHLFPSKKRKEPTPIAMVALIFAERRGRWLTHRDVINLINKRFADSTVLKAFKELSRPLDVLGGHSFIDTEPLKTEGKGSPTIRGRLSEDAEKIFTLVTPVKQKPESYFPGLLNGEGRLEMPPLQIGDKYLSPEEIIRLRIQKSGEKETRRLLRKQVNDIPGAEKEAMQKMIDTLAEQQGMTFNATNDRFYKGGKIEVPKDKLAEAHAMWKRLPGKESPYAKAASNVDILKTHHFGPFPHCQYFFMDEALRELASDENRICLSVGMNLVDSRQDDARVHALEERALKGEEAAFDQLIQVLSSDASKYARQEAARSLGHLHNTRAVEPLIKAMLNDEYSPVRNIAAEGLGNIGDLEAIPPLTNACNDPDSSVREMAKKALEEIGKKNLARLQATSSH